MSAAIVKEICVMLKDYEGGDLPEELNNNIRKLSARANIHQAKNKEEKKDEADYLIFYPNELKYKGKECISLSTKSVFIIFEKSEPFNAIIRIPSREIIGIHPLSKFKNDSSGVRFGCVNFEKKKLFTFDFETNPDHEEKVLWDLQQSCFLCQKINNEFKGLDSKDRRLLVLLNPVSGSKKAEKIFEEIIKPVFDLCHFTYEAMTTKEAGHATEIVQDMDLSKFNEIAVCSGDGLVHEVIQGLFRHKKLKYENIKKIPLSVIPCGTGNALSWEMGNRDINPIIGALVAARGRFVPFDIVSIVSPSVRLFSFLFFAYGVIPDVDLGYKPIKWMGDVKYIIGGLLSCLKRNSYPLELDYVVRETPLTTAQTRYNFPSEKIKNIYKLTEELEIDEEKKDGDESLPPLTLLKRHFGDKLEEYLAKSEGPVKEKKMEKKKKEEEEEEEEVEEEVREEKEEKKEKSFSEEEKEDEEEKQNEEEEGGEGMEEEGEGDGDDSSSSSESEKEEDKDEEKKEEIIKIEEEEEEKEDQNDKKKKKRIEEEEEENEGEDDEEEEEEENIENIPTIVKQIRDKAFFFCIANTRKFSHDIWAAGNMVPGNGSIDLLINKPGKPGIGKAFKFFGQLMGEKAEHLNNDFLNVERVQAFHFNPVGPKYSLIDVDGEELKSEPVMGQVHKVRL